MRISIKKLAGLSQDPDEELEVVFATTYVGEKNFKLLEELLKNRSIDCCEKMKDGSIEIGLNDFIPNELPSFIPTVIANQINSAISKGAEVLKSRKKND